MKIYPKPITEMDDSYLMELLRQERAHDRNLAIQELKKRLLQMSPSILLKKWAREKNETILELLEVAISQKYLIYDRITDYNRMSSAAQAYFEEVTSLDAIVNLLQAKNKTVKSLATRKYNELLESYFEKNDELRLYETEGDDSWLPEKEKNSQPSSQKLAKIYQFKKYKEERK